MDVRFEDHPQFQRAAGLAVLGAGTLSVFSGAATLPQLAVVGGAFGLALAPGLEWRLRLRRLAGAAACLVVAAASLARGAPSWLLPLCGALLGLLFALARLDSARAAGAATPARAAIAIASALAACAAMLASIALPPLSTALASLAPPWLASGLAGAAFGLWAGLAAAPLHVAIGADPVELRLSVLRAALSPETRLLAERAAAARRGAAGELPPGARADLRGLLDTLALAALDVADRVGSLSRAAPPSLEEELQRRSAQLAQSAGATEDPAARASYQRAAEALEGQLEHFRRVRRARDRALALLHEEVANLERARFSLTLLRGADAQRGAVELDLLHDRLQHGALAFEAEEELAAPPPAPVRAL